MEITIRTADEDDLAEIQRLWQEMTAHHTRLQPHRPFRPDAWEIRSAQIKRAICSPETDRVLLAETKGSPRGVLWAAIREAEPNPRRQPPRYAEIEVVAVSPSTRGRGVGSLLMEACQEWLDENNITRTVIKVVAENDGAVRFYERFGYRAVNVIMEKDETPPPKTAPE